jgi:hypothetical protein
MKSLPPEQQLQVIALVMRDLAPPLIDDSEGWSEEDMRDATRYSLARLALELGEGESA